MQAHDHARVIGATPRESHGAMLWALLAAAVASALYLGWLLAGTAGGAVALGALALALAGPALSQRVRERLQSETGDAAFSRSAFADFAEEMALGLGLVDDRQKLLYANKTFLKYARGEAPVVGRPLAELFAPPDTLAVSEALARLLEAGAGVREMRVRMRGSPDRSIVLMVGYSPRARRFFATLKDDSLQLRIENQTMQATKMQAVGQLAGGIAHDFNNILTAIIGACDLMLMRHGPGDIDFQDVSQVRQNAIRAANLVRQLLAFSRQQTLQPRLIKVEDVLGELAHLLRRLLGERVRLRVVHGRDLAPVRADPGQLEQVIVNLGVNARDAMPEGGDLTITTFMVRAAEVPALGHAVMPSIDYVAIEVTDTGTGIAPENMGKIFDPFFTTKEVGKGTGLGLSMAYGIVKQTGGFIFAQSEPGRGTAFSIYLPASEGEVVEAVRAPERPPPVSWGHGTILVVEDETMVRAVAQRALARSGYEVLTAANGEEALSLLEDGRHIDLLVSDVVMPGMDGPTLVARARETRPDLPVLFISGYAEEQVRQHVVDPRIGLLRKPFSVHELGAAVRERLAA